MVVLLSRMVQKFTALILLFTALFASFPAVAHAEEKLPSVSAKSAILINADTGAVLYAKNEKERLPMASTTTVSYTHLVPRPADL